MRERERERERREREGEQGRDIYVLEDAFWQGQHERA